MDAELLDLLADRLAERLAERLELSSRPREALIDASEVARRMGKMRAWDYEHSGELGAMRLGSGTKPRLGFLSRTRARIPQERRGSTADVAAGALALLPTAPAPARWIHRNRGETARRPRPSTPRDVTPPGWFSVLRESYGQSRHG